MKYCIGCIVAALVAVGGLVAGLALAQDKKDSVGLDPKAEELMKKAEAASMPGPSHKLLEPLAGDWNVEAKCWMSPGTAPMVSKGTEKSAWVLNGRFIQQEFNGEFLGKPFRGIGFIGYDQIRQKYNCVWMDDMSTTMVIGEGDADPSGKVLTFGGTYACAMTGEKNKATKQTYRILNRDQFVFEMHDPAKDNFKTMEITYTRK